MHIEQKVRGNNNDQSTKISVSLQLNAFHMHIKYVIYLLKELQNNNRKLFFVRHKHRWKQEEHIKRLLF